MAFSRRTALLGAAFITTAYGTRQTALAQADTQTLNMAVGAPVTSLDPHFHQLTPNNSVADMIFDTLTKFDGRARLQPALATEFRAIDENTWEFKLRPNVRFHNGNPFTAEDVAFTFARIPNVPNSPASYTTFVRPMKEVIVVDPLTVRIRTDGPYPLMPIDIASLRILNKATHENATTEDFNSGKVAIGTGPFKVIRHQQGDRIEFERNDNYWGEKPAWAKVNYRMITNDGARTAALHAGDVQFIDTLPTTDLARARTNRDMHLSEIAGTRLIYLALDQHRRTEATPFVTDHNGKPITPNPLCDARVRKALSLAIDRPAITARVMEGASTPAGQFLPMGCFGSIPDREVPRLNIEEAKRLLAEAGFPNGFKVTLHSPSDRYVNDSKIAQAIGQMWTRIGVHSQIDAQPWTSYVGRVTRGELSIMLYGWTSTGAEASNPLRNLVSTISRETGYGASNRGRYSNPALDALVAQAMRTLDDKQREATLQEATRVAMDDVALIPLHFQTNIWAMRRGLKHEPRVDELTRAQDISRA